MSNSLGSFVRKEMEPMTIPVDPQDYFQKGKGKISKGLKHLQELVKWSNRIPGKVGLVDEIVAYLQSLQRQVAREIESLAQHGEAPESSNVNGTDLHGGQEIIQSREQNVCFGHTPNENIVNVRNSSGSKRKRRSNVWEHFIHYVKEGKELAQCKHCEKEFVGSSKKGTTHLRNHLNSCPCLRNPGEVANKEKEKSVIDPKLNGADLLSTIIKCGVKGIKDGILDVYQRAKDKFCGHLDKLPCRFNVRVEVPPAADIHSMSVWFIDDSWKLQKRIIYCGHRCDQESKMTLLRGLGLNIDKSICSMTFKGFAYWCGEHESIENLLNIQDSLPVTMKCLPISYLFGGLGPDMGICKSAWEKDLRSREEKLFNLASYVSLDEKKFQLAVDKAMSKGKEVTSQSFSPLYGPFYSPSHRLLQLCEWAMECKEAFCELEDMDPHFKDINFTKKDWDELTILHNHRSWFEDATKLFREWQDDAEKFLDPQYKTANEYFSFICQIFSRLAHWEKSDKSYVRLTASHIWKFFDKYWKNSILVSAITLILDPRFKRRFNVEILQKEMGNDVYAHLSGIVNDFNNIFHEYATSANNCGSSSPAETELNRYFTDFDHTLSEQSDILEWWRDNSSTYPTLARMARDFLSIPITASAFDDLDFDVSEDIEDIYARGVLHVYSDEVLDDDLASKFMCMKTWFNNLENN